MRQMRHTGLAALLAWAAFAWLALPGDATAREAASPTGVVGVDTAQLEPNYWIARQPLADAVVLDRQAIAAQNTRLLREDRSTRDIAALPAALDRAQVGGWIRTLSARPSRTLYDADGREVAAAAIDGWTDALALDTVPSSQAVRYGLVVQRAPLRTFPTMTRVFSRPGNTDIDRFQENAFFPGTPVAIVHASRDGKWWFVVGDLYVAWIEKRFVAEGGKAQVFDYVRKAPYLVVTGANVRTTKTPDEPRVSDLQLDMGIRLPLLRDWPGDRAVSGQAAYTGRVVELPVRNDDGSLAIVPALIPRSADVSADYLPLTRANLLRQAFKFLGERYGWGHDYGTRDCSGFVSEVYRSMGVTLPRNTRDQGMSPALNRIALAESDGRERREAVLRELQVGDLVYIPGHVMLVIGHDMLGQGMLGQDQPGQDQGTSYVIHDTNGGSWNGPDGKRVQGHLNGVSVTPLTPMQFDDSHSYVDRITNVQRIRP